MVLVCSSCWFDFFFFKQKTAYEMRISDWSSDVCSSDLTRVVGVDLTDLLEIPGTDADALYESFAAWAAEQGTTLYPAQDEALMELASGSNEIGRASCRERVCQYV